MSQNKPSSQCSARSFIAKRAYNKRKLIRKHRHNHRCLYSVNAWRDFSAAQVDKEEITAILRERTMILGGYYE